MTLGKLKYARPYLRVLAQVRQMGCQDGSSADNAANNACTLGTVDDTPAGPDCGAGGLPLSDCAAGTTAGTSSILSTCLANGSTAAGVCAGLGNTPATGVTYSACSAGTGVTN